MDIYLKNATADYELYNKKDNLDKGKYNDSLPDKWAIDPTLEATSSNRVNSGTVPTTLNTDYSGQLPTAQTPLNGQQITQDYKEYYQDKAQDPLVSPFIRVFPGLE